jgi:hypothetical protein
MSLFPVVDQHSFSDTLRMILRLRSVYVQGICRRSVQLFDQSFLLIVLSFVVDQSSTPLFFLRCSVVPCAVRFVVSARWHNVLFLNDDWRGTEYLSPII